MLNSYKIRQFSELHAKSVAIIMYFACF